MAYTDVRYVLQTDHGVPAMLNVWRFGCCEFLAKRFATRRVTAGMLATEGQPLVHIRCS